MRKRGIGRAALAALAIAALGAGAARADRVVSSNEPVVISDDITKRTTAVRSGGAPPGVSAAGPSRPAGSGSSSGSGSRAGAATGSGVSAGRR